MSISHAVIVGAHSDVDMAGVCYTTSLVLDAFKRFSEIKLFTDYKVIIDEVKPDFTVISTPARFHYQIAKYTLEKGINTFCEKPFALTTREVAELVYKYKE